MMRGIGRLWAVAINFVIGIYVIVGLFNLAGIFLPGLEDVWVFLNRIINQGRVPSMYLYGLGALLLGSSWGFLLITREEHVKKPREEDYEPEPEPRRAIEIPKITMPRIPKITLPKITMPKMPPRIPSRIPPSVKEKNDMEEFDQGLEALNDEDPNPNVLSKQQIRRIIASYQQTRMRMKVLGKSAAALVSILFLVWIMSDFFAILRLGGLFVLYLIVFYQINAIYPSLMFVLYVLIALLTGIVYALPYRIFRKKLRVIVGGKAKDLGRVVLVRGADKYGNRPPGLLYSVWYAWRTLTGRGRPNPHEFPFGDAYYLFGRTIRVRVQANGDKEREVETTEPFNYCLSIQPNTEGWFRRRLHPVPLYVNGDLDIGWFMTRVVGAGFKLYSIPRKGLNSTAHYELSGSPSIIITRDLEPYRKLRNATIDDAAGLVVRGVKADSELQKDAQREFNLPSPSTLAEKYGLRLDDEGNPIDEKAIKVPKDEEKEA